jgi:hypothetical protein
MNLINDDCRAAEEKQKLFFTRMRVFVGGAFCCGQFFFGVYILFITNRNWPHGGFATAIFTPHYHYHTFSRSGTKSSRLQKTDLPNSWNRFWPVSFLDFYSSGTNTGASGAC